MALPAGVNGVTVSSGQPLTLPDGTPIEGKLLFSGPDVVTVNGQDVVLGGTTEVKLVGGAFTVTLAANDVMGMNPTGWTYRVTAAFSNAPGWVRYIALPKAAPSVTLSQVIVPDAAEATYIPVVGPKGDQGDPGPKGDTGAAGPQPPLGAAGAGPTIALKSDDPSTTNARTPTAHASTHGTGGTDPVSPASIGAYPATDGNTLNGYVTDLQNRVGGTFGLENRVNAVETGKLSVATFGNVWVPSDHGLTAWTFDPAACGSAGTTLSPGFIYLVELILRQSATINRVHAVIGTAGSGLTANQCMAGLYDSSGNRVGITGDMSTTWNSVGNKTMSLSAAYPAAADRYYVAFLFNGTTSPNFACGSTHGNTFTPGNAALSSSSYRFCRSAAGQTSLPSSITLSGFTPDANNVWSGAS